MVVTLKRAELAARLRLGRENEELNEVDRLLTYVQDAILQHCPDAPDSAHNEAATRLAAYIYDAPFSSANGRHSNFMRFSGAAAILTPYLVHRLGMPDTASPSSSGEPADTTTTPTTPITAEQVIRYGYSDDDSIDVADFTQTATGTSFALVNPPESAHMVMWRSNADGGDFTLFDLGGTGNQRGAFSAAMDLTLDGIAGKAMISEQSLLLQAFAQFGDLMIDDGRA